MQVALYEFCSDEMKKQLDGPREAVRHEEDRKANADRAVKKAKQVCYACFFRACHILPCAWEKNAVSRRHLAELTYDML
jgi:hypothetical protein